jgi:hypothetical protein
MSRSAERLCGYLDGHILTGRLRLPDPFFYQLDANRHYRRLGLLGDASEFGTKCGCGNEPLDKQSAVLILAELLNRE